MLVIGREWRCNLFVKSSFLKERRKDFMKIRSALGLSSSSLSSFPCLHGFIACLCRKNRLIFWCWQLKGADVVALRVVEISFFDTSGYLEETFLLFGVAMDISLKCQLVPFRPLIKLKYETISLGKDR
jgi:hypothetical protein